jgi:hypothetical protein
MGQDASQIRHEIEATRLRMGDTLEAIAYKADVRSRVRDNVNERIAALTAKETLENPLTLTLGAFAIGFFGGLLLPARR